MTASSSKSQETCCFTATTVECPDSALFISKPEVRGQKSEIRKHISDFGLRISNLKTPIVRVRRSEIGDQKTHFGFRIADFEFRGRHLREN